MSLCNEITEANLVIVEREIGRHHVETISGGLSLTEWADLNVLMDAARDEERERQERMRCEEEAERAAARAEGVAALQQAGEPVAFELGAFKSWTGGADVVSYIARYGGMCRGCADEHGICPGSGLPCDDVEKPIRHVLEALSYGLRRGYITLPQQTALVEGIGGDSSADLSRASSSQRLSQAGICRVDLDGDDLDDIAITGDQIAMLRLERMDKGYVWGNVHLSDGRSLRLSFHSEGVNVLGATGEWEGKARRQKGSASVTGSSGYRSVQAEPISTPPPPTDGEVK